MATEAELSVHVTVMPGFANTVSSEMVARVARATVMHVGISNDAEMGVVITDDAEMHALNQRFCGVDHTTDVLSFAFREQAPPREGATGNMPGSGTGGPPLQLPPGEPEPLGDVVVSYPRALEQAAEIGHSTERELAWLIVHGTLQLLGYEHDTPGATKRMHIQERLVLAKLGYEPEPGADATS